MKHESAQKERLVAGNGAAAVGFAVRCHIRQDFFGPCITADGHIIGAGSGGSVSTHCETVGTAGSTALATDDRCIVTTAGGVVEATKDRCILRVGLVIISTHDDGESTSDV